MRKIADSLAWLVITAWIGSLWGIGYVAVPVLFQAQPDRMLAGMLAGKMFTLVAYIGMVCACYLLIHGINKFGRAAFRQTAFRIVILLLLLTIIMQFGIQPIMTSLKAHALPVDIMQSAFAGQFKMLHGISSLLYLAQSLLGAVLVLKTMRCSIIELSPSTSHSNS